MVKKEAITIKKFSSLEEENNYYQEGRKMVDNHLEYFNKKGKRVKNSYIKGTKEVFIFDNKIIISDILKFDYIIEF